MSKKQKNLTSSWGEIVADSEFLIPVKELSRALIMYNTKQKLNCPHNAPHVQYAKEAMADSAFATLLEDAGEITVFSCSNDNKDEMCCLMYHSQQGDETVSAFTVVISTEQSIETGVGKNRKSISFTAPVLVMNGFLCDINGEHYFLAKEGWCADEEESNLDEKFDDVNDKFMAFGYEDFRRILCVAAEAADSIVNDQPVDAGDVLPWLHVPEEDIERKLLEATADPSECFTDIEGMKKSLINGTHSLKAPSALQ